MLFIASFAGCPRVWKMASTLSGNGFKVTLLEWDRVSVLPASEYVNNIRVYRMRLNAPYGLKMVFRLPLWWFYVSLFLLSHHFTVIQPQNLDNLFPSFGVSRIKKMKIVYDIADFYADAYLSSTTSFLRKATAYLERAFIKATDKAIIVDECRLKQIAMPNFCPVIIYNSPPDEYVELSNAPAKILRSSSQFTLLYAGILAKGRGLDALIQTVSNLISVNLIVAGFGGLEKEFRILSKINRRVKFLGQVSYEEVLKLTFSSDCIVALYDPSAPNNIFASPNKLFEAMMCAKPIVVTVGTAMAEKVLNENCGLVVEYNSVAELQTTFKLLDADRDFSKQLGQNGRDAYLEKYCWSLMENRLLQLYASVTGLSKADAFYR